MTSSSGSKLEAPVSVIGVRPTGRKSVVINNQVRGEILPSQASAEMNLEICIGLLIPGVMDQQLNSNILSSEQTIHCRTQRLQGTGG